jgi:hypothetical protein
MRWFKKQAPAVPATVGSDQDTVWNRATMEAGGTSPREGDRALADLLRFHSLAMNGGVLHGYEICSEEQVAAALAGYGYFGLDEAVAAVAWLVAEASGVDLESDQDAAERLEVEGDERYARAVPTDAALFAAFELRYRDHADAFAPVSG